MNQKTKTLDDPQRRALAEFNFAQKYARYVPELSRRETWTEATARVMQMHREHLGELAEDLEVELHEIERLINERRILGSQRSLQFGGPAVLAKHARSYNCTSCYIDDPRRFAQALYLLLCGAGVGYSVQRHHVDQLPAILDPSVLSEKTHQRHLIPDSIEGWCDAFDALIRAYTEPDYPVIPAFDFSQIRPKGAPISSCGGKAPSAYPLRVALTRAESLLIKSAGRQLRPIDASDLMCILADCVLAGGVRRSALLCMFDSTDHEMIEYKSAFNWWVDHPYRARANISALIRRDDEDAEAKFEQIFESTRNYGEPAVIWVDSTEVAYNPCVEIGMCPTLIKDPSGAVLDEYPLELLDPSRRDAWIEEGYTFETAWQFCNLCEINASAWETMRDAETAVYFATILGMIQARYTGTDHDYLSNTATREILEREYLLGVSLTGLSGAPAWARERATLRHLGEIARRTSAQSWERLGLKSPPSRVTCVKPSGNAAVNLGCASGVHPEHAPRYIRRIQVPRSSPIAQAFATANPHAALESVWSGSADDYCLEFAIEAPKGALTRDDLSATEFLAWVQRVQMNWVREGTARPLSVESLTHNVSNTCTVKDDEWHDVAKALIEGRHSFGGVSCLSASGDYDYPQAPFQRVYAPEEIEDDDPRAPAKREAWRRWHELRELHVPLDYATVTEDADNTDLMSEGGCYGGQCEAF
jgi:ribonucleoside-diphosphate reductase alpha chain